MSVNARAIALDGITPGTYPITVATNGLIWVVVGGQFAYPGLLEVPLLTYNPQTNVLLPIGLTSASFSLYGTTRTPGVVSREPSSVEEFFNLYDVSNIVKLYPGIFDGTVTSLDPSTGVRLNQTLLDLVETLYTPSRLPGLVTRSNNIIDILGTLYNVSNKVKLYPGIFDEAINMLDPKTGVSLNQALLDLAETLYGPTRTPGPVSRTSTIIDVLEAFYAVSNKVRLTPSFLSALLSAQDPTTNVRLNQQLLTLLADFYGPDRLPGPVSRTPPYPEIVSNFYDPSTNLKLYPGVIGGLIDTYDANNRVLLNQELLSLYSTFFNPDRIPGPVTIYPDLGSYDLSALDPKTIAYLHALHAAIAEFQFYFTQAIPVIVPEKSYLAEFGSANLDSYKSILAQVVNNADIITRLKDGKTIKIPVMTKEKRLIYIPVTLELIEEIIK